MHGLVMIGEYVWYLNIKPTTPSKLKKLERNITWEPPCMQSKKFKKHIGNSSNNISCVRWLLA
jgi:hypothetical protein